MMNISTIIQYLYPSSNPLIDWVVVDSGDGPYIAEWNLPNPQPSAEDLQKVWDSTDFQAWNKARKGTYIDRETGEAINEAMHPFAGIEEQIGVLRVQIGEILNAIGLAPTADFDRLNTIAAAKIQEAAVKKEAL